MLKRRTIILPIGGGEIPETGTLKIVAEGTYDVSRYAEVVVDVPYTDNYFCLTARENNSSFSLYNYGGNTPNIEYSTDKINWTTWDYSTLTLEHANDKLYFRGNNPNGFSNIISDSTKSTSSFRFITGSFDVSGDIMTLLSHTSKVQFTNTGCFSELFAYPLGYNNRLINARDLILPNYVGNSCYQLMFGRCRNLVSTPALPATSLAASCYQSMFYDCESLTTAPVLPATTLAAECYKDMFSDCIALTSAPALPATTLDFSCYTEMFKRCTALTSAPALPATTLNYNCYDSMFQGCTALTTAPALPATTLWANCYGKMFYGCTALTTAPALPATIASDFCYYQMFYGCTALTTAPALPATTLGESCYKQMFQGCTALTTAPALPATTLAQSCYYSMFQGCTALTTASTLSANTLADSCCYQMFYNCRSLTTAPALPATTLAQNCYKSMFQNCRSLTTAPALPATVLADNCYSSMFNTCVSLTSAPALPATTLAVNCYQQMFYGCTALASAPSELPATTLAQNCYYKMFQNCTSLTSAPEIKATSFSVAEGSVAIEMFRNCSSLNKITVNVTTWINQTNWVFGVAQRGDFYNNGNAQNIQVNNDGIPTGWVEHVHDFFYIENLYNGLNTVTLKKNGTPTTGASLEWSGDKETWRSVTYDANNEFLIGIPNQNQKIYFRSSDGFSSTNADYYNFIISDNCKVGGDLRTLLDYTNSTIDTAPAYAFRSLFNASYHLSDAGDLDLSKLTTLSEGTFRAAFSGCNDLEVAPILYATTLATDCYRLMFYDNFVLDKLITYFPTWQASYTASWLNNVAATGDFYNFGQATIPTGTNGIPTNWTEHTSL